ncbi:MAG: type II secretion system protein GspG [Planctomycetes bacterium]|nr:type II secretion system protein GspG [Planctomycetota bacterium]
MKNGPWMKYGITALAVIAALLCTSECRELNVFGERGDSKERIAENEIRSMCEQVELYRETRAALPNDFSVLTKANLIKNAQEDGTVLDPWRRPYIYILDQNTKEGFVISSKGADENSDADDIRSDRFGKK